MMRFRFCATVLRLTVLAILCGLLAGGGTPSRLGLWRRGRWRWRGRWRSRSLWNPAAVDGPAD